MSEITQEMIDAAHPLKTGQSANLKRRPYNASGSLSEYGVFPESDAQ